MGIEKKTISSRSTRAASSNSAGKTASKTAPQRAATKTAKPTASKQAKPKAPIAKSRPSTTGPSNNRPSDDIAGNNDLSSNRRTVGRKPNPSRRAVPDVSARFRVVISDVAPEIDHGRFPIKRTVGESVAVEANIFTEGHDIVAGRLIVREVGAISPGLEVPMLPLGNDRFGGSFVVAEMTDYEYGIAASVDHFLTWRNDLAKRIDAQQDVAVDLLIGAKIVADAASRAGGRDAKQLQESARALKSTGGLSTRIELALSSELCRLMAGYPDRTEETVYPRQLRVRVERERARFSSWYEFFPRSCIAPGKTHGTFADCHAMLPYIASMGFNVAYLPPIHPIGRAFRKGPNNQAEGGPDAAGSPWAIGAHEGGHTAIHPELGTLEDFRAFVTAAKKHDIEIALDLAWQCSPDHPYVREHPEWFRVRPDGTIQYAENPPKKYQDIYPFDFECADWKALWAELRAVVEYWIEQGVAIFRVDNPHTKPFDFWEWFITDVHKTHPEVIFLSEAFTRPNVMYELAKRGFTQSYTYFAWRNTKRELQEYLTEVTQTEVAEYFRPNLWPNTPDILPEYLQSGGRPAFAARLILAATLGASYGIYGPAFELCEHRVRLPGTEDYLDSEKYEIKRWDLTSNQSLIDLIARVNRIRLQNPALQTNQTLAFHEIDNDQLLLYSKSSDVGDNTLVVAVNLNPHVTHSGMTRLDLGKLGIDPGAPYQVHDLLSDQSFTWQGERNFIQLDPQVIPAHILLLKGRTRSEKDSERRI